MTPAAIAYAAMQVCRKIRVRNVRPDTMFQFYFALTSAPVFNPDDPVWQPFAMYYAILEILKSPELEADVQELIDTYNK